MEINKTQRYIFEKGEVIMFSEGIYSDYHCKNIFQVLKTFDIRTVMKNCKCNKFKKRFPWNSGTSFECRYCYDDENTKFCIKKLAEAEANGFIKELNYIEIWEDPLEVNEWEITEKPKKFNPNFISGGTIKERSK